MGCAIFFHQIFTVKIQSSEGELPQDGYRWRKYGQKNVKGSQFPRSYYKCTEMSCPVKKQVERTMENNAEIFIFSYDGTHCHAPPGT